MSRGQKWADLSPRRRRLIIVGAVAQVGLQSAALVDLYRRSAEEVNGPKARWVAASFVNFAGPIAYFVFGRRSV
jgi:hypothetical protein